MGLNDTPSGERLHIGFFGRRNAGKSSLVNAVTGQDLAVVSDVLGTTTDPVYKSMELLPLGPVMIIDTPGFDDTGHLGELRVKKTKNVLNKTDIAILVVDAQSGLSDCDRELIALFQAKNIRYIVVYNKSDLLAKIPQAGAHEIYASAQTGLNIFELKELIGATVPADLHPTPLIADLVCPNDFVVLVVPVDKAAPKGRLILPQQQTIRDLLEAGAVSVVVKETELAETLKNIGKKPKMVVTDSQAFAEVSKVVPLDIPLTSFSILMARYKGFLEDALTGVSAIDNLKDGDTVLVAEGCTHHRQCNDIGTVKIPRWLKEKTGKDLNYVTVSGTEFPDDLSPYALVVHCGGCMLKEREVTYRSHCAVDQGMPITNYGILIAHVTGILKRSLEVLPDMAAKIK